MLRIVAGTALIAALAACSPSGSKPAATSAAPVEGMGVVKASDFRGTLPMKELMAHVIDYNAFGVWKRQGWWIDREGEHEYFPTTEEEWFAAESSALTLAEASNLLLLPGRMPDENRAWIEYANALHDTAIKAHDLAVARDKQGFFDAGGEIYVVCRDCHSRYIVGAEAPQMSRPPSGNAPAQPNPAAPAETPPPTNPG